MRFTFSAAPTGGVRLIGEIPDFPLCRIEGRNGIGKTLAIHLLELAAGGQPYAGAASAWRSLREHLGPVDIVVSGLRSTQLELRIHLSSESWPADPPSSAAELGTAFLGNEPIALERVAEFLHVVRIAGNETITSQFRAHIDSDVGIAERQRERFEASADRLLQLAESVRRDVFGLRPDEWERIEQRLSAAVERRTQLASNLLAVTEHIGRLRELALVETAQEAQQQEGPALEQSLQAVEREIKDVQAQRTKLEARRQATMPAAEREQQLLQRLQKLSRDRERQAARASEAVATAGSSAQSLGLASNVEVEALDVAKQQAELERTELLRDRAAIAALPEVVELIGRIRAPLEEIEGSGLDQEVLCVVDGQRVAAKELRAALGQRERELRAHRQLSLVEEIDARIRDLGRRAEQLVDALRQRERANTAAKRLEALEELIRQTSAELEGVGSDEYAIIVDLLRKLEEQLLGLIERRVQLRHQHGLLMRAGSAAELESRAESLQKHLQLEHGMASAALLSAASEETVARESLLAADDVLSQLRVERSSLERRLGDTIRLIEKNAAYDWLRTSLATCLPDSRLSAGQSLERLANLDDALDHIEKQLNDLLTNIIPATIGAMRDLGQSLGKEQSFGTLNPYMSSITKHYEEVFGQYLSAPEIQVALFERGRFQALDLRRAEVAWDTQDGEPRKRPIEAFSSGERAFAYTLASVLQRSSVSETASRLLVLDEFGAFIEAGRLEQLLRFLQYRVLDEHGADQVLIILPLRFLPGSRGTSDRASLERSIRDHGYYAREVRAD